MADKISQRTEERKVILAGNPNVGKSVLFRQLTGQYVTVSNYPGTTVEVAWGRSKFAGHKYQVIDTPGINSLRPLSEDEKVARDLLFEEGESVIVQVADAKNLRRTLWLTLQLCELGIPMILALNIMDEARTKGVEIDVQKLSKLTGLEIVPCIATQQIGTDKLIEQIPMPKSRPRPGNTMPKSKRSSVILSHVCRKVIWARGGWLCCGWPETKELSLSWLPNWLLWI